MSKEIIITDPDQVRNILAHRISGGYQSGKDGKLVDHAQPRTKITMIDLATGKKLWTRSNKVVITGGILNACYLFGVPGGDAIPTYNSEMNLDNSVAQGTAPDNNPIVCLFCMDDSGCGPTQKDVYTVNYIDRISPETIFPFRYVDTDADLTEDLRLYYFGRKTLAAEEKIAYYFKAPDTTPQLHLRYADGTQISEEDIYEIATSQNAECFIETRLRINRYDFRDYFDQVLGWDHARYSSLSLCYAWYRDIEEDGETHRYYQSITPYTKLNFPFNWLYDLTKGADFIYDIYY